MTEDSEEATLVSTKELEQVTCIKYPIVFPGGITQDGSALGLMSALLDLGSQVNTMHPAFAEKLGLVFRTTNVGAQKINGTTFKTYGIVVAAFSMTDQANRVRFFEEIFLVANISPDMVLRMPFFTLNNVDIDFPKKKLWWRSYTIKKTLPTTKRVKLVGKKEFAAAALDPEYEIFVVYIASLESSSQEGDVHPSCRVQIAALVANGAFTLIPIEYSDFVDVFFPKLALELPDYTGINDHAIELVDDWQPPYAPIYSLSLVEMETLKTYIEINLKNGFIRPFKSLAGHPIFFDKKPDRSLQLCIDY